MNSRVCCILILPLLACAESNINTLPTYPTSTFSNSLALAQRIDAVGSLFPSDSQVIGNDALNQILAAHPTLPAHGRIAVLALEPRGLYHYYWSEELLGLNQQAADKVLTRLRACPRVANASILPALLVPERRTIPYLREAAARYQADMLLVYQASTSSFEKQKIIGPGQVKAICRVDAVLLDTRSGIVPFTSTIGREYQAQRTPTDLTFEEAVERAKLNALCGALGVVADELAAFLDKLPPGEMDGQPATRPAQ